MFKRHRFLWIGVASWYGVSGVAYLYTSQTIDLERMLLKPTIGEWFGTDGFGRSLLQLNLAAHWVSGLFAFSIATLTLGFGLILGASTTFFKPSIEKSFLRLMDALQSIPFVLIALTLYATFGSSWLTLTLALTIGWIPGFWRLTYYRSKELRAQEFVQAAHALGASPPAIIRRHYLPHLMELAVTQFPNQFTGLLLAEISLSFIGVGVPKGANSLGTLLHHGSQYLIEAPHIAVTSGLPLTLLVYGLMRSSRNT